MGYSGIGGQAVMEGVMMKNGIHYAVAVRKPDKEIVVDAREYPGIVKNQKIKKIPILRGVINFIDSLVLGMRTLMYSASFFDEEAKELSEEEQKAKEKKESVAMGFTVFLSVILALVIFMLLPYGLSLFFKKWIASPTLLALIEGVIRVVIFFIYIVAITCMEDIKRVYMYHGAEHKCINCVEHGLDLNVENVKKSSRFHKRCGTSFLFLVVFISILFFACIRTDSAIWRFSLRILLVPVIAGVAYEFLRLAGRSENAFVNLLSKPGLWFQKFTTKEPDEDMIEVAIASVEAVFDWKEYQSRLQAVKKSTKRKKVAEEMRKSGMTAPLPIVDPANAKKKSGTELASEIKKREQEYKKRADERKKYMEEMQKREDEIAKVMDEVSKRKEERQALAQAQEEMTEDELSSLDRFFDDPDGTKTDMESKPSVDEVENG